VAISVTVFYVKGVLYLVSTPIGNLEDITLRATGVLREADLIACEDTRHTRKLLNHLGLDNPPGKTMWSYHEHNEKTRALELVERLKAGQNVALVSDAGTPLVSDPGFRLVEAAIAAGIEVRPIPGPSAALAGLAASGLPTDSFRFCGFLPAKSGQRRQALEELRPETCTLIFYEAPHRLLETLADIAAVLGDRPVVVARELTKLHEEFLRGSADSIRRELSARPSIKGEITILAGKPPERPADPLAAEQEVRELEQQGVTRRDAVKRVAKARGIPKRELYRRLILPSEPRP
jgi:16S rRNA (cytidine1402-2'-O)-methyltransferase